MKLSFLGFGNERDKTQEGEVSFREAQKIMGKDLFGPKEVKAKLGVTAEAPIQFTANELREAKRQGDKLILFTDKTANGEPLTIFEMDQRYPEFMGGINYDAGVARMMLGMYRGGENFSMRETPRPGYRLVSKNVIPDTPGKNFFEQTEMTVAHLQGEVYKDIPMPAKYRSAIARFKAVKPELATLLTGPSASLEAEELLQEIRRLVHEEKKREDDPAVKALFAEIERKKKVHTALWEADNQKGFRVLAELSLTKLARPRVSEEFFAMCIGAATPDLDSDGSWTQTTTFPLGTNADTKKMNPQGFVVFRYRPGSNEPMIKADPPWCDGYNAYHGVRLSRGIGGKQ